jgi:hypothetical protein
LKRGVKGGEKREKTKHNFEISIPRPGQIEMQNGDTGRVIENYN